jgi:hypothetical protein
MIYTFLSTIKRLFVLIGYYFLLTILGIVIADTFVTELHASNVIYFLCIMWSLLIGHTIWDGYL